MGGALNFNHLVFLGHGALWTIGLSLIALIGGGAAAFLVALCRVSPLRIVRLAAGTYVQLIQGTPLLVIMFLSFFGLAAIGLNISPLLAAGASMTIYVAAYLGEIWRGCIEAVPKPQWEAAEGLALTRVQRMVKVILPQAIRIAVPLLTNRAIAITKGTALGTAVSLPELLGRAQSSMAIAANPSPLTLAAALYLLFFVPLVVASRWLEGLGAPGLKGRH